MSSATVVSHYWHNLLDVEQPDLWVHIPAFRSIRDDPKGFTDMPLDERDLALIHAPPVPGVEYSPNSRMCHMTVTPPGTIVPGNPSTWETLSWTKQNDERAKSILAKNCQTIHGFEQPYPSPVAGRDMEHVIPKVKLKSIPDADWEWAHLSPGLERTEPPEYASLRIFRGPVIGGHRCDGMILRDTIPTLKNTQGTSIDRCWDVLLIRGKAEYPWIVCALREVPEPGRVIFRVGEPHPILDAMPSCVQQ